MDEELSTREREDLGALRREVPPPPEMEGEILARLSREGLLAPRGFPRRWVFPIATAAAAATFVIGLAVGGARRQPAAPVSAGPRYVLFVESSAGQALSAEEIAGRVQEYRGWSLRMRAQGHGLGGEKLAAGGWSLDGGAAVPLPPPADGFQTGGYFLLTARDDAEAVAIARTHPHLKHGGRMVLRRIEDV